MPGIKKEFTPRISVGMTRREFEDLHRLSRRCNTSTSALGQLALKHLLLLAQDGTVPMLPDSTALSPIIDGEPEITADATRISVGVTPAEMTAIRDLAARCNMSVSALGQLALKQLLIQAQSGAIPMLPPSTIDRAPDLTNMELRDAGFTTNINGWGEEAKVYLANLEEKIALLEKET